MRCEMRKTPFLASLKVVLYDIVAHSFIFYLIMYCRVNVQINAFLKIYHIISRYTDRRYVHIAICAKMIVTL